METGKPVVSQYVSAACASLDWVAEGLIERLKSSADVSPTAER